MDTEPSPDVRIPEANIPEVRLRADNGAHVNRWLVATVAVLAVAVVGLGARLIVRSGSEVATPTGLPTAPPATRQASQPTPRDWARAWMPSRAMHRWIQGVNALDAEAIAAVYTADAELHVRSGWPHDVRGATAIGRFFDWHVNEARPFHIVPGSLRPVIAGDDHFVFRFEFRGTGMSDLSRVERGRGFTLVSLDEGRIAQQWYTEVRVHPR